MADIDADLDGRQPDMPATRPDAGTDRDGNGNDARPHLVIVGDILLDVDITGSAERLSPEAPVPVVTSPQTTPRPGGAGLTALIAATEPGWQVSLIGALGRDENGNRVRALLLDAGIDLVDLDAEGATPSRTRVRARGYTLVRIDENGAAPLLGELPERAVSVLGNAAAVLVCDYGRGMTSHEGLRRALADASGRVPLVWDPHPNGRRPVQGVTLTVPNSSELRVLAGADDAPEDLDSDVRLARSLLQSWPTRQVAVTRGSAGAVLVHDTVSHPLVVPCRPVEGDTCGAGDRFAVTTAILLAEGRLASQAVAGGVEAATKYVAHGGPSGLRTPPSDVESGDALLLVEQVRARGGRIIGTGGCFDLLHAGHLSLLEQARRLGDCLVVCLNSDRSVRDVKGPRRPVVDQAQRAAMLRALSCVDGVLMFEEDTPNAVLDTLRPDIWVKGGDYTGQGIPESDLVESWGGQVVLVAYLEGNSTTSLIERVTRYQGTAGPGATSDDGRGWNSTMDPSLSAPGGPTATSRSSEV